MPSYVASVAMDADIWIEPAWKVSIVYGMTFDLSPASGSLPSHRRVSFKLKRRAGRKKPDWPMFRSPLVVRRILRLGVNTKLVFTLPVA
jgi:hypothetical protein